VSSVYKFVAGETPLLVSVPHAGTEVPKAIADRLTSAARSLPDTDWHVDHLYEFAAGLGAGFLVATHSRYFVDLNRGLSGVPLYPGATNTGVCPTEMFGGAPIYNEAAAPDADEVDARVGEYWRPYHDKLTEELTRLRQRFGVAVLFDAHSIGSSVPRLFDGELPVFNLGTASGASANENLRQRAACVLANADGYDHVVDGRFTGGFITRTHGKPDQGIHALQLEMAQRAYMDEASPFGFRPDRADAVRPVLIELLSAVLDWTRSAASGE
jgi:N-formylglutamate deformylase